MEGIYTGSARPVRRTLAHQKGVDFLLFRIYRRVSCHLHAPLKIADSSHIQSLYRSFLDDPTSAKLQVPLGGYHRC